MDLGVVASTATGILGRGILPLLGAIAAIGVPGWIVVAILEALIIHTVNSSQTTISGGAATGFGVLVTTLLLVLLELAIGALTATACFTVVDDVYRTGSASIGRALRSAFGRVGSVLWAQFLLYLLFFAAGFVAEFGARAGRNVATIVLVLLFAFIIWVGVQTFLFIPAILFDGDRGTAALARSSDLVKGSWWRCFGYLALVGVVILVVEFLVGLATGMAAGPITTFTVGSGQVISSQFGAGDTIRLAVQLLITMSVAPLLGVVVAYLLFVDLRLRRQGLRSSRTSGRRLASPRGRLGRPLGPENVGPRAISPFGQPLPADPPPFGQPLPADPPPFGQPPIPGPPPFGQPPIPGPPEEPGAPPPLT